MTTKRSTSIPQHRERAWDLIGHEGQFRISRRSTPSGKSGRTVYDAVMRNEATARPTSNSVRLTRLAVGDDGIHQVNRWVDGDTWVWVIRDFTAEAEAAHEAELAEIAAQEAAR